jgi:hypothetical protein
MRPYYVKLQNDSTYRRCLSSETAALAFAAALGPDAYIEPVPAPASADIPRRDYGSNA